jgi:hypothetical protein
MLSTKAQPHNGGVAGLVEQLKECAECAMHVW